MDHEGTLRLLFPQVDARLIKATVLDGDDINSALDFLIREGMQSAGLKPEKASKLASNNVHIDGTHIATNHLLTPAQNELYPNDFLYDKHEEAIVWKGGLVSRKLDYQENMYATEGQGLDDFYESGHQQEEATMRGNEQIDWWTAMWPNAIGLKEHDVLDSSSSVQTDLEVQEEAGSPLRSDTELYKLMQQRVNWQRPIVDTDGSSTGSPWGNVSSLNTFHKGCKSLMDYDLPLSQDSLEVFPPMALCANTSEQGVPVSSSDNRPVKDNANDDDNKLLSCFSVTVKRDCPMQESLLESSRYLIATEDLDKLVLEARCRKDNMRKDMEDICLLRQKAEQEELVAQRAKAEASHGGEDILLKVGDLQQQILHERAEYDMRAAEVYGEKSILSMEARELRSRLLETQAEQARALSMLNSVRCTLAERLEKASQGKQFADEEAKLREESAKELLAREEESARTLRENFKALETEAETCQKLREFLIERGNIVDSLQGEMAVLCEDILNFKKQVDEGIPLSASRSLSWSHMSNLTEQFASSTSLVDVKDDSSPESELGLLASVGPIDCSLQSQYFSPNANLSEVPDEGDEKGLHTKEASKQKVEGVACILHGGDDGGQKQENLMREGVL